MKKQIFYVLLSVSILIPILTSCSKDEGCYSEKLYQEHKDDICTMDCPTVIGCDGETYCNECIARTHGIEVIK